MSETGRPHNGWMVTSRTIHLLRNITSTYAIADRLACCIRWSSGVNTSRPHEQHIGIDGSAEHFRRPNINFSTVPTDDRIGSHIVR